eukprot:2175185-Pleurochrysis_carterae.AAC.2
MHARKPACAQTQQAETCTSHHEEPHLSVESLCSRLLFHGCCSILFPSVANSPRSRQALIVHVPSVAIRSSELRIFFSSSLRAPSLSASRASGMSISCARCGFPCY